MGTYAATGGDSRIRTSTDPDAGPNYSMFFWVDLGLLEVKRFLFLNNVCIIDMNPSGTVRFRSSGTTAFTTITGSLTTGKHFIGLSIKSTRAEAWIDGVSQGSSVPTAVGNATGYHLNETAGTGFTDCEYAGAGLWTRFVEPWEVTTMYSNELSTFTYTDLQIKWDFNEGVAGTTISDGQVVNIQDPSYNSLSQGLDTPEYGTSNLSIKYRRRRAS